MSPHVDMALLIVGELIWGLLCHKLFDDNAPLVFFITNAAVVLMLNSDLVFGVKP